VGPTANNYGREGEGAGPMKWIELTVGPAERNMPTRIKGGSRVTTGLTEKRVRNGIGKKYRDMMSGTIKDTEKD
jgi:hypothetical protein